MSRWRNGESSRIDERIGGDLVAIPQHGKGLAGIACNGPEYVEANLGKRRGRNSGTHRVYSRHPQRQPARHRDGQYGKTADPRENEQAPLFCSLVESRDAIDKCGTVGEIDIDPMQAAARPQRL